MRHDRSSGSDPTGLIGEIAARGGDRIETRRPDGAAGEAAKIARGTPAFRRARIALLAAGFSTFAVIYCVQPLMPVFVAAYGITPAQSSLSLSLTTATLAFALLVASSLAEVYGRKPVMTVSLMASAVLTLVAALVPDWHAFLLARALTGLTVSGVPAVAMAYISEEVDPPAMGLAMGLFIGGSGLGGLAGRLISGVIADFASWPWAVGTIGALSLVCALAFWRMLPPSAHFVPHPPAVRSLMGSLGRHLRDPGLRLLFVEAFLLMGASVTVFNYATFRLVGPPFHLSQAAVGFIFLVYLAGSWSSAWMGDLAARIGSGRVLVSAIALMLGGLLLTATHDLVVFILGITAVTCGFFGAHSVASSWVGKRAREAKAQASALYLFLYYTGSSIAGTAGGTFWARGAWPGVMLLVGAMLVLALGLAVWLARLAPVRDLPDTGTPPAPPAPP